MGDVLSGLRRYEEGIEYFTRAIRVNEKNGAEHETNFVHALLGVGRARMLIGKPREALLPLERALRASATAEAESPEWQAGRRRRRALHSGEGAVGDESARATCRRARA
jgi:tetratricopeptide (TPR) repeat protein